jgi:protein TonB
MLAGHAAAATEAATDQIFALADLDQAPRAVFQPAPEYPSALRKQKLDGTVHVLFMVDKTGRVESPLVQKSTNPGFEAAALQAVKRWRFEPGKRNGEPVVFRMRVPITFKK